VLALTGSQSVTTAVSQVTHRCSLSQPRGTFDRYPQFCQLIPSKTELKLLLSEINLHTMRQNAVCLCKFVCGFKQPYRAISYITDDCRAFCHTDVGRRPLRSNSNDTRKLLVPRTHNKLGDRSFSAAGPRLWNDLPPGLRHPGLTFDSFRLQRLWSYDLMALYKSAYYYYYYYLWKLIYLATEGLTLLNL